MDQLRNSRLLCVGLVLAVLVPGCTPSKTIEVRTETSTLTVRAPFAVPYVPRQDLELEGLPVAAVAASSGAKAWDSAVLYSQALMSEAEKALFARLEPAGGVGLVAPSFTRDFDADGRDETVSYGAFTRGSEAGNFVLVTRAGSPTEILFEQEFVQLPTITAFTLKPDNTLWFGGGIDAGEVIWKLWWSEGKPVLTSLLGD